MTERAIHKIDKGRYRDHVVRRLKLACERHVIGADQRNAECPVSIPAVPEQFRVRLALQGAFDGVEAEFPSAVADRTPVIVGSGR